MTDDKARGRIKVIAWLVAFMFIALATRLWFLQVLAAEDYRARADTNRVRLVPQEAARGRILDSDGNVLVGNRPSIVITVDRREADEPEQILLHLSELLDTPAEKLADRMNSLLYLPYQPIPVFEDAPEAVIYQLAEHRAEFPGVAWDVQGVRDYPYGRMAVHALGYLGQINEEEAKDPAFRSYRPGTLVGRGGVEQQYERYLRGQEGWLKLEVNAQGKVLDELGSKPPVPGHDVVLSIDQRIQQLAESSLKSGIQAAKTVVDDESGYYLRAPAGSVVVMDPRNGRVVAMASFPDYEPEFFLTRHREAEFKRRFIAPARNQPLLNRVVQTSYPPGSTFKPFVAAAAVRAGHAQLDGFYNCPPEFTVPGDTSGTVFHNWTTAHLGYLSLGQSLVKSCDTVYYQFGLDFYRDRRQDGEVFQKLMRRWGFGHVTGIDLPFETPGRVPDADWKASIHKAYPDDYPVGLWYPGDNINMSIGQGDLLVSPMQLATAYSALVNGGTLYRPQVALRVQRPDGTVVQHFPARSVGRVPFKRPVLESISDALRGVTTTGTAASAFLGFPHSSVSVAAKTGTAEVLGKQPHSWFAATVPAEHPRYVIVVMVEEGGHGSQVAAPIVRQIIEGLYGLGTGDIHIGTAQD
jgi:penicillin-binding protein 2